MWTEDITCRLMPIPASVRAFTVRRDGCYTVIISESLSASARLTAWEHEIDHIRRGDFDRVDECADLIEVYAHSV